MLHNKIRYLFATRGLHMSDYAKYLGRSRQSISVKFKNESFAPIDLITFAEMTGTRLAYIDDKGKIVIELTRDDLPEKEKKKKAEEK